MDFQSLSRRELQALCKSNKIPANLTNVAMADALAALSHVEGLEEAGRDLSETPLRQTASRTTTRRKPAIEQEPEGSILSTRIRRAKSNTVSEKTDEEEEENNINSLQTPAALTTRSRAPVPSARTKLATEKVDKKKAPAAATGQSVYSTRRSTRLLEKTMAELTLTDTKIVKPNAIDEEAPKDTIKPIRMDELQAEEDTTPKGICNEDDEKSGVIPKTESNENEGNKDIEDEKSSVILETESKREVVVVHEATKEETLDNGAEENKDDTTATRNVGEVVGVKRDFGSGEELLVKSEERKNSVLPVVEEVVEGDDQTIVAPEYNNVVAAENANEEVEGEKILPDVEEGADLEVMDDDQTLIAENANEEVESEEGEKKSLPDADKPIVAPECNNVVAAENANKEDEATQLPTAATSLPVVKEEKESGKEEEPLLLLQVYADPESVPANNTAPAAAASMLQKMMNQSSALVDVVNKENNIHERGMKVVEPLVAIAVSANAVDDVVIQKKETLVDKSVRQLRKMLKEKLVISNKESGDEAPPAANLASKKQQQQVRQALQKLPENFQAVGEAE